MVSVFTLCTSISLFSSTCPIQGCGGVEKFVPAVIGQEAKYTLERSPVYHQETDNNLLYTPTVNIESPINLRWMSLERNGGKLHIERA